VLRVISGDNELQAMDFQKHYRMQAVCLMDPNRSFERQYNRNGWPFLMLVDETGEIMYQCNNLVERDKTFMQQMQAIAKDRRPTETRAIGDVPYRKRTLEHNGEQDQPRRNERFASIACGTSGDVYTVYTEEEGGDSNVCVRIERAGGSPEILKAAATEADEYDGTVIVDAQGRGWVLWTSNRLGNAYNIYLSSLADLREGKPALLVSQSKEDCMHGRMAADHSGLWITYYKWQRMGRTSRDKEVYVRHYDGQSLSEEQHVSPEDVPTYEDHTDPAVAVLNGRPVVCWSWDFHKPQGYTQEAASPTIFARAMNASGALERTFHVSGKAIDMTPVLGRCGDSLWCAWDSLGYRSKSLCIREIGPNGVSGGEQVIAKDLVNVCSPAFAFYQGDRGVLTWSQTENGKDWALWKADYNAKDKTWGKPSAIVSEGNPRFGSCAYDSQGTLWLACSVQTEEGRQITVREYGNSADR